MQEENIKHKDLLTKQPVSETNPETSSLHLADGKQCQSLHVHQREPEPILHADQNQQSRASEENVTFRPVSPPPWPWAYTDYCQASPN